MGEAAANASFVDRPDLDLRHAKVYFGSKNLGKTFIDQWCEERQIFHWPLEFPDVFGSDATGFDAVIGNPPYVQIQKFSGKSVQKNWERQNYETLAKTGDIYCLFYEKGYRLLRKEGVLAFITSNKWMRAAYGEKLRRFFSQKTQPQVLIDFSSFQVFDSATVDTNVLLFTKENRFKPVRACLINSSFNRNKALDVFVSKNSIELTDLSEESWVINDKANYEIKKKIEVAGKPLKNWDIVINYGIKTGFNEAFIIDGKKRAELIAEDPKSEDFIKPFLIGRDLKRYKVLVKDSWLLFIPWHFPLHDDQTIKGASSVAEKEFELRFPALYRHLLSYKNNLANRNKSETGISYEWYALQRCAASYYHEFSKKKVVWGNLALSVQFALAKENYFVNAPGNLITGPNLLYLLAVLNSSVADYYIRSLGVTRNGGYFEYKPMFVEQLPVPQMDDEAKKPFEILAEYVLLTTTREKKIQSAFFEQLIDAMVYELYFPGEITSSGKNILAHFGSLTSLSDDMSEEEKLSVIQREFDRLYDPSHPVRNTVETIDSVDVVHIIREALKR
ncbi:N-6 DNA methylase [Candidatus Roizmanbacteria bacterium]|nr:N-6 DNA methylase [Candidatus Roizmanbacteria bacterium]